MSAYNPKVQWVQWPLVSIAWFEKEFLRERHRKTMKEEVPTTKKYQESQHVPRLDLSPPLSFAALHQLLGFAGVQSPLLFPAHVTGWNATDRRSFEPWTPRFSLFWKTATGDGGNLSSAIFDEERGSAAVLVCLAIYLGYAKTSLRPATSLEQKDKQSCKICKSSDMRKGENT